MKRHSSRSNKAFTLIELMLAIGVMGLLTTAAVFSFAPSVRAAQTRQAIEWIRDVDAMSRTAARNFNRAVALTIDLESKELRRREGDASQPAWQGVVPGGARIDEIRIGATDQSFANASIRYSTLGLSQTYAVRLTNGDENPVWLVFAGLSGEMTEAQDESQVQRILATTPR